MLCPACRRIFSDKKVQLKLFRYSRYEHHNPPYLLKEAAESGCYICVRIWNQLSEAEKVLVSSTSWWKMYLCRYAFFELVYAPPLGAYTWVLDEFRHLEFQFGSESWKKVVFDLHEANGQ